MSFDWLEKDRALHQRDLARAYGAFKRQASREQGQEGSAGGAEPGPAATAAPAGTKAACTVRKLGNVIAGKASWAEAGFVKDLDPARGTILATIPRSGPKEVAQAVEAARAAQPGWAATPLAERCAILRRAADLIEQRLEQLALLESLDTGKPVKLARSLDIPRAVANFRFFADFAEAEPEERHDTPTHTNRTVRAPVGVVGLITPWNLPLYLLSWKAAPALAMGNAVVAKPSELTPQTADALAWILKEAGLPDGVFNVVHGYGHEAGQALVEHPDVRAVSFTGGTATGRKVAATAAAGLKKLSLELGGKNPTIVFADCDLEAAVAGVARSAFWNTGQICLCGSRILVEQAIEAEFTRRLVEHLRGWRQGDPQDPATDLGSVVSPEHREKVESYLRLARDEGATFLLGGGRPRLEGELAGGAFVEPTLLAGLPQDSRCVQEEVFGPVATIQPFRDEAEAVRLANGVRYGLSASVWTQDPAKADRVAEALETGMVWVNCWLVRDLRVPFGGVKESGLGREGGRHSLDFFSEPRNICAKA
jgi:aminomuconate-semialdehyde/2-hydroxymuconate-6-semialdehyde dehydrogenase